MANVITCYEWCGHDRQYGHCTRPVCSECGATFRIPDPNNLNCEHMKEMENAINSPRATTGP